MFIKRKKSHNILLKDAIRGIGLALIHSKTDMDNCCVTQKEKHEGEILKKLPQFLFHISDADVTLRFEIKKVKDDGDILVNMSPEDSNKTQEIRFQLQQKSF